MGSGRGQRRRVKAVGAGTPTAEVGCYEDEWERWVNLAGLASARVAAYYLKAGVNTVFGDDEKTSVVNEIFRDACDNGVIKLPPGSQPSDFRWRVKNQPGYHGGYPGQSDRLVPLHDSLNEHAQGVYSSTYAAQRLTTKTRMKELGIILYELALTVARVLEAGLDSDYWDSHQ